ncbi:hypothetical protein BKP56_00585 [Marinilactibacillus sp. 15R]|uniref:hypothetical protein n=1 Tax=Marinilactibacillus sp. 15R TaxID=1911586 RepID=UPI00090A4E4E|nr:hypothetical protein [Marinilactibacillus sp. 15R]API87921.1 hypothetical protein BKP56_00585 [Marinilactibacillus sp. 15R]
MEYKKLIGLLAVSGLLLAACDSGEDEASDTTETEQAENESDSAMDIIDNIDTDSLDYTSAIELEMSGATWTEEGYLYSPVGGEAVITGTAVANEEDTTIYAYIIQGGEVTAKPEVTEGEFTYPVSTPEEDMSYEVGVSNEDLWEVGDEADAEELVRHETVIVSSTETEPAAEE